MKRLTYILTGIVLGLLVFIGGTWFREILNPDSAGAAGDLVIDWYTPTYGDPIFVEDDIKPGDEFIRQVSITNASGEDRTVGMRIDKQDALDILDEGMLITLTDGVTTLFGPGNLATFITTSQGVFGVPFTTLLPGESIDLTIIIEFDPASGNSYQSTDLVIDIIIGITEDLPAECAGIEFNGKIVIGTEKSERLFGSNDNDLIIGLEGNDRLYGRRGDDCLIGGEGNDRLYGQKGNDVMFGGPGKDSLYADKGDDYVDGGADRDIMNGGGGVDHMYGRGGDDRIDGDEETDYIYGGAGDDDLMGDTENDEIYGGDGDDEIDGGSGDDTLFGGNDDDDIDGRRGDDDIYGEDGNDKVDAGSGNDYVSGGNGDDKLNGRSGDDQLFGDADYDKVDGSGGDDECVGEELRRCEF